MFLPHGAGGVTHGASARGLFARAAQQPRGWLGMAQRLAREDGGPPLPSLCLFINKLESVAVNTAALGMVMRGPGQPWGRHHVEGGEGTLCPRHGQQHAAQ